MLLAAARLRIGGRRLRALARGDADGVRDFIESDSALRLAEARRDARADGALLEASGARIVALGDDAYPAGLCDLRDPPAFLCVRGVLPARGVAIVGTREPSPAGRAAAAALAGALGLPVVSGLARGIDAAAHAAAADAGLPQIAYLGTGIARTYPPEHAALAERIVEWGGALASERLPHESVSRWALVRRDRLQAAHAAAVVLVESEADGGAMHTMTFAAELGRPRYVFPLPADGNEVARRNGAAALPSKIDAAVAVLRARAAEECW